MRIPPPYPFLAAAYLTLTQVTQRGEIGGRAGDVAGSALLAVLWTAVAWWGFGLGRPDYHRRALLTLFAALWAGLYGTFQVLAAGQFGPRFAQHGVALSLWTGLLVGTVAWLGTRKVDLARVTRAANVATAILLALPLFTMVTRRGPDAPTAPTGSVADTRGPGHPDVYLIVLDKYSHPRWLAARYGLDVRPFLDSLRALGFTIPDSARTNYIHTSLVLATLLNWTYMHEAGLDEEDPSPWASVIARVQDNAVVGLLRGRGYRFAFFPSTFPATTANWYADLVLTPPGRPVGGFASTWLANGPWQPLWHWACRVLPCPSVQTFPYPVESAAAIEWKLEQLASLPDSSGPIFALLHLLVPHEPYIFHADCRHRRPRWPMSDGGAEGADVPRLYAAQVACVNQLLLRAVTALVARSRVPPVILVQSDHGHGRIALDPMRGLTRPLGDLPADQIAERVEVLAAYRFPGSATAVWHGISPVNVLPLALNAALGLDLPLQADRTYWSPFGRPLDITEVH